MRYPLIVLISLCWIRCLSQTDYDETLAVRLDQIKKSDSYDHKVVFAIDSVEYHDMSFPFWKPNDMYYQDDIARYKYCSYAALRDSKGHRPDTARTTWTLVSRPHPALFLRDTAKVDDLKRLLLDKHEYVKTYAFAALSFRKEGNLFPAIVSNLGDTTQMTAWWGDSAFNAYPADLMIEYALPLLSKSEKTELQALIRKKYPYLSSGLQVLRRK
jgi:hypothetical protein